MYIYVQNIHEDDVHPHGHYNYYYSGFFLAFTYQDTRRVDLSQRECHSNEPNIYLRLSLQVTSLTLER